MQLYIFVVLLLSSGAVSAGLENVLRQAEFIADIYQQFPHICKFIINCEAQHQSENEFYIAWNKCVFILKSNILAELWRGRSYVFPYVK